MVRMRQSSFIIILFFINLIKSSEPEVKITTENIKQRFEEIKKYLNDPENSDIRDSSYFVYIYQIDVLIESAKNISNSELVNEIILYRKTLQEKKFNNATNKPIPEPPNESQCEYCVKHKETEIHISREIICAIDDALIDEDFIRFLNESGLTKETFIANLGKIIALQKGLFNQNSFFNFFDFKKIALNIANDK